MRVVVGGQREVALRRVAGASQHVFAGAHQLHHRERNIGIVDRIGSFAALQELIEGAGIGRGREGFAVARGQFHDARPALGSLDDAPNGTDAGVHEGPRHDAVGGDHEIFNQRARAIFLASVDALHFAVGHNGFGLDAVDVQRAQAMAFIEQNLRRFVLQFELFRESGGGGNLGRRGGCPFKPRPDSVVGQLRLIADQRGINGCGRDRTIAADDHVNHHGHPVGGLVERCEIG